MQKSPVVQWSNIVGSGPTDESSNLSRATMNPKSGRRSNSRVNSIDLVVISEKPIFSVCSVICWTEIFVLHLLSLMEKTTTKARAEKAQIKECNSNM